jgi:glycosyltransferase involved in cell wall biosynthesis
MPPPYPIAFVLTNFARGGMEMRLADVVNSLDTSRWNPHVYAFYESQTMRHTIPPERLHVPLAAMRRDPSLPLRLAWRFRREQTTIVWALTQGLAAGFGRLGAVLGGVPIRILSLHDVFPIAPLTRSLTPITDAIVTNSRFAADHAIRSGLPAAKLHILPNGIDTQRYQPGPDCRANFYGIPPERPVILHVGRLEPDIKGQDVLLKAVQPLMQRPNPPLVVFVGEGIISKRDELEHLSAELGIQAGVRFVGLRSDTPALMQSCDLLVMSSRTESSPNVVIEAQACAKPVIAAQVGGTSELLLEGQTGFLIPPDDPPALTQKLNVLLDQAELRQQMGQAARHYVEMNFSIAHMTQGRVELFERLLAQKGIH